MVDHDLIPVAGRLGARSNADYALRLLDNPKGRAMSRFKTEVVHLQAPIKTLRIGTVALLLLALVMGGGWWSAPRDLTIYMPPELSSGRTRTWWEVHPESVYGFTFSVLQKLTR